MSISFQIGQYVYTRIKQSVGRYWSFTAWPTGTKETFNLPSAPAGYEYEPFGSEIYWEGFTTNLNAVFDAIYGSSKTESDKWFSYNYKSVLHGSNVIEVTALRSFRNINVNILAYAYSTNEVSVTVADNYKGATELDDIPSTVSFDGNTYTVVRADDCFAGCTSLVRAPALPTTITSMSRCFKLCSSLTQAPSIPSSVTNMSSCFNGCTSLTQAPVIPNGVTSMIFCFYNCTSLIEAPVIPNGVTGMDSTFNGCTSLTEAPVIPNSVRSMSDCFYNCASLTEAPKIPSNVINVSNCFKLCTSLTGNVEVESVPTYYYGIFDLTRDVIFIVDNSSGDAIWKTIANTYQNVHYEVDDNPAPNISDLTLTRVSTIGSTDYEPTGLYAYIKANVMVYDNLIPVGWTNELKGEILTDNGTVESVTWQPSQITEYPSDIWCWISLGDTSGHTITLQIFDSIKNNGIEIKTQSSSVLSKTITKSYALIDYYHDETTDTEGIAIGKYAEHADLLDVDMPALFRQNLSTENILLELDTTEPPDTTTTDGQIHQALKDLNWTDVIVYETHMLDVKKLLAKMLNNTEFKTL